MIRWKGTVGMGILITLYLAIGASATAWSYYGGVVSRPSIKLFTAAEQVTLAMTAIGVGLLWLLFLPGLVVAAIRHYRRQVAIGRPGWHLHARTVRARS